MLHEIISQVHILVVVLNLGVYLKESFDPILAGLTRLPTLSNLKARSMSLSSSMIVLCMIMLEVMIL
jgi:hypothetical protein